MTEVVRTAIAIVPDATAGAIAMVFFRNPVTGATFRVIGTEAAERLLRELPGMWVRA